MISAIDTNILLDVFLPDLNLSEFFDLGVVQLHICTVA